jgi:hypothetical protein
MKWILDLLTHLYTSLGNTSNIALPLISTLYKSLLQTQVFSSPQCPHQSFPSNGCDQWRFFSYPRSGPSCPANIPQLNSFNSAEPAWGPRYTASGRTQRKAPLSAIFILLLWAVIDSPDIVDVFSDRYQAKHIPFFDHCLATAVHATE